MALDPNNDIPLPKRNITCLQPDGRVYRVDFSEKPFLENPELINWDISYGKMVIGKFQLTRNRFLTVDEMELENVYNPGFPIGELPAANLSIRLSAALNGKDTDTIIDPVIVERTDDYVRCATRLTAKNLSILIGGQYNMTSFTLTSHIHGRR